jgi:dTMP kinase
MRGAFISFEGGEGAGKTTQIKLLAERLKALGHDVVVTREPGGTKGAEAIRELILNPSSFDFSSMTETLLFFAARRDHVEKVILPAQKNGTIVLCDRFMDSTLAYQSALGHVEPRVVHELAVLILGDLKPDLTFVLDIEPEQGLQRAALRRGSGVTDRFESESLEFHELIRMSFLAIAKGESERCVVISGDKEPDVLAAQIFEVAKQRLGGQ